MEVLNVKHGGTCSYYWAFKGLMTHRSHNEWNHHEHEKKLKFIYRYL